MQDENLIISAAVQCQAVMQQIGNGAGEYVLLYKNLGTFSSTCGVTVKSMIGVDRNSPS